MAATVIRVVAKTAKVRAQPVNPVAITPGDGARVLVVATPGPPGPPGSPRVFNEEPGGVKDGVNAVFTLAQAPEPGSTTLYRNGLREQLDVGYTLSGSEITFSSPPLSTDDLTVDYLLEG